MKFIITKSKGLTVKFPHEVEIFNWYVCKNDSQPIAQSVKVFHSEQEARANIAQAKIALRAARFAKVVVQDGP